MKKTYRLLLMITIALFVSSSLLVEAASSSNDGNTDYEIYPEPQGMQYNDDEFVIRNDINVVYEKDIDEVTKKRVKEIFEAKNITISESEEKAEGTTNVLIGTFDSGDYVDTYVQNEYDVDKDIFSEINPYVLTADNGTISILGKDTDAAFYGVTTLKLILEKIEGKALQNFQVEDYADTTIRGFIEGYYGIPWSDEDRMSLMEFGGNFKMTTYVFAPKDDPYHNSKWREPYPEERLAEMKEMVDTGRENKVNFAWTIHPFMSDRITDENYDEDLDAIITKFEQLYDIGVRQFGVLADDAGAVSPETVVRVLKDLSEWAEEKGDVYDFLTVPGGYNTSWVSDWSEDGELSIHDAGFPDDVQIMWTGDSVVGHITQDTIDTFKTRGKEDGAEPRRDPVIWLNWPVNDINMNRLMMGKGEMLNTGVEGLAGSVTNPMQDAEASKVALFALADYTWNLTDFDEDKSWEDSFTYIDPDASDALHTLAKHMSDPAPNGHGLVLGESEELKGQLEDFLAIFEAGDSVKETGEALIEEFEEIIAAAETFLGESNNDKLKEEIEPYANSLMDLSYANIAFIETAIALENNNDDAVWANYVNGSSSFDASKKHDRPLINDQIGKAIPGSKRLVPFAEKLNETLAKEVEEILGSDKLTMKPITNYGPDEVYEGKLDHLIDGDDSSKVWFGRYIAEGDYVGVEFSEPIDVKGLTVLQGKDENDEDGFHYGKFQYYDLVDDEWKDTSDTSYGPYENEVEETGLNVTTDKVRFIVDADKGIKADDEPNPKWAAFREFKVSTEEEEVNPLDASVIRTDEWSVYQGEEDVENFTDNDPDTGVWYKTHTGDVSKEGDYFGLDLGEEVQLGKITIDLGAPGKPGDKFAEFDLQYSLDGESYTTYKSYSDTDKIREDVTDEEITARYVRVVNTKEITSWIGFRTFNVQRGDLTGTPAYTNAKELNVEVLLGTDRFELLPAQDVTLADGEYVGIKLKRIHDLNEWKTNISTDKLTMQIAKNEYEWKTVTDGDDVSAARYIRLLNESGETVTFDIDEFVLTSHEIEAPHLADTNLANIQAGTEGLELDGDLTTATVFEDHQRKGKYLIYDVGQEIDLKQFEIYLHDSSLDFIYDGIVSHSTDKENWTEFLTIGDQEPNPNPNGDINDSYPNHKVSYNTIEKTDINEKARYIKIEITEDVNRWVQFNEIMINDGEYFKVENDARFDATVIEERGGQAPHLVDGDLNSMYIPSEGNGSLTYYLSEDHEKNVVTILQSENTISNAVVEARVAPKDNPGESEIVEIGKLSQSLNRFQLPADMLLYDIEIKWEDDIPHLYEMTFASSDDQVDKSALEDILKQKAEEDWTSSSKETYNKALALAEEIFENEFASQQAVDSAVSNVEKAYEEADFKGDPAKLEAAISDAKENDEALYTKTSWDRLENAIEDADKQLEDIDDLSEAVVEKAVERIESAVERLRYDVTAKENAMIAVEDAEAFLATIEDPTSVYTEESYNAYIAALDAVNQLLEENQEESVIPTSFTEATETLLDAKDNLVDASVLFILIDEFGAEYEADEEKYTEETFAAYVETIEQAKTAVIDGSAEDIADIAAAVKEARDNLILYEDTLSGMLDIYGKKDEADYTADSFAALEDALAAGKVVNDDENASEEDIEDAKEAIRTAVKELVNVKELNEKIAQAQALEEDKYTPNTFVKVTEALEDIDPVLQSGTEETVAEMIKTIVDAIDGLVLAADQEAIEALQKELADIDPADYTTETAKALTELLKKLDELAADENATATAFATLKAEILEAEDGLVSVVELKEKLEDADSLSSDDYTEHSFKALQEAIEAGEALLANGSEAAIADAIAKIESAINDLLAIADVEKVEKAVVKAEKSLERKDLKAARKLANDLPDSPEKIELLERLDLVEEKIKINEEEKEEPEEPTEPTEPTDPSDPKDPGNTGEGNSDGNKEGSTNNDEGEKLPSTATNTPTILLIGFLLTIVATALFVMTKRRMANR